MNSQFSRDNTTIVIENEFIYVTCQVSIGYASERWSEGLFRETKFNINTESSPCRVTVCGAFCLRGFDCQSYSYVQEFTNASETNFFNLFILRELRRENLTLDLECKILNYLSYKFLVTKI